MEFPGRSGHAAGLSVAIVEWLPSGGPEDLVRVRGATDSPLVTLPELVIGGARFQSLPDLRGASDPAVWRGAYLVSSELLPTQEWALEWPGGVRLALGEATRGLVGEAPATRPAPVEDGGGEVIDRAVLAERRARRAEGAEQAQAHIAAQALKALELLERRGAELERRLEDLAAERDALLGRAGDTEDLRARLADAEARVLEAQARAGERAAGAAELDAALAAVTRNRLAARDWRLHLRVAEIARTAGAVRLAVLESSVPEAAALQAKLRDFEVELTAAREVAAEVPKARELLENERQRRETAQGELEAARAEAAGLRHDLARVQATIRGFQEEAEAARAELEVGAAETGRARVRVRLAENTARAESVARATLGEELDRTRAELERLRRPSAADMVEPTPELATAAAEQVAAARAGAATGDAPDLGEDLDRAAEELRRRFAQAPDEPREKKGSSSFFSRGDELPWLRGAIVRMAREEPELASRLLVGLLPAQGAVLSEPLEYDLTLRGVGTFGVSVGHGRAEIQELRRRRRGVDFHLIADPVVLAELLAGRERAIGRFSRGARVKGGFAHRVSDLWEAARADFTLESAARAGARLDPGPVFHALAYVIDPGWTRGHRFTVAQEVHGEGTWYIAVADGEPVRVHTEPAPISTAASVSMSRETFDCLLRRELPPTGARPIIRGDRAAVDLLRTWTERAQGR